MSMGEAFRFRAAGSGLESQLEQLVFAYEYYKLI